MRIDLPAQVLERMASLKFGPQPPGEGWFRGNPRIQLRPAPPTIPVRLEAQSLGRPSAGDVNNVLPKGRIAEPKHQFIN